MASHQDRVRRNYHTIEMVEHEAPHGFEQTISIQITRMEIATRMSKRDLEDYVLRKIQNQIRKDYKP